MALKEVYCTYRLGACNGMAEIVGMAYQMLSHFCVQDHVHLAGIRMISCSISGAGESISLKGTADAEDIFWNPHEIRKQQKGRRQFERLPYSYAFLDFACQRVVSRSRKAITPAAMIRRMTR